MIAIENGAANQPGPCQHTLVVARPSKVLRSFSRASLALALMSGIAAQAAERSVLVMQALTGPSAFVGVSIRDGMLLAIDESNKKQELGAGNSLKAITADDASDRNQTLTLLQRHAADPNVLMVMGPTSGAAAVAGANAANDLKIPLMTTSNSLDILKAGPWSYILTQPPFVSLPYIVKYAVEKLQVKNCTLIGIGDIEVYTAMQKHFEDGVKARGVRIGSVEAIKSSDADFSALATKVASRDQDCVFVSATAPQGANIILQLRQAGFDPKVKILGHVTMTSPQFVQRGGAAVEGVYVMGDWLVGGRDDASRAFARDFKAKYNAEADSWNAVGYSAMRVAITAIKNAGSNPSRETVRAALAKTKDVPVVVGSGKYSYDEQRVPTYGMNVLQVKGGQFVIAP